MSPARRKKLERIRLGRNRRHFRIPLFVWPAVLLILAIFFVNVFAKFWNSKDKLTLAINAANGDVIISTFDPTLGEVTNITIPGSTQVNVSRQLGTWKLRSVWALGQNEKIAGKLLAETITKNFKFPTAAWADSPAIAFGQQSVGPMFKAVFTPYSTNLKIGDRIKLALFSLGVKNTNRVDINLAETAILQKAKLVDGKSGYLVENSRPDNIMVIFSDSRISSGNYTVNIKNASTDNTLPESVGGVLQVLGAKIASVVEDKTAPVDCEISGKDAQFVRKVAEIYSCKASFRAPEGSFDMELRLGEKFVKRY